MKKSIIILIIIIILIALAYIGYIFSNKNIENNSINNSNSVTSQNNLEIKNYNLFISNEISNSDLERINNIYYIKISNYEEYKSYKNKFSDILDMSIEDFENNFMIITYTENISTAYLLPYKIDVKDNTLYLGMKRDMEKNPNNSQSSMILPKEADVANTIVYQCIDFTFPTDKYTDITTLPEKYPLEQAQEDDCYISNGDGKVYNEEILNSFLNAVNNNEDCFIRMLRYSSDGQTIITDVYYISENIRFYVRRDTARAFPKTTCNYYIFTSLEKENFISFNNRPIYYLTDESKYKFTLFTD